MSVELDTPPPCDPGLSDLDKGGLGPTDRLNELTQIISAYNQVTEKLQTSHEALRQQVARLQQELASTDAQLRRSKQLAALGEMAAGIAHEIRNPLAAIGLYAQMLVEDLSHTPRRASGVGETGPEATSCAQTAAKIAEAVRGLNAIVDDVLNFARQIMPRRTRVRIANVFDRAIEALCPLLSDSAVELVCECSNGLSLLADSDLLHRALVNLIRNAVDAMVAQSLPRLLQLGARREDEQIVLTVRDTGPGIRDQDIDRIFNPFFTTRPTGTGLGLAIVHRIADAHGGTICVHNDAGAVFELSLPIGFAPNRRVDHASATIEWAE